MPPTINSQFLFTFKACWGDYFGPMGKIVNLLYVPDARFNLKERYPLANEQVYL